MALAVALQLGHAGFRAAVPARHGANPGLTVAGSRRPARRSRGRLPAGATVGARRRGGRRPRVSPRIPARLRAHPERLALLPDFTRTAAATGVRSELLEALAWQESGWQDNVVSRDGAVGVGQLLPVTVSFTNGLLKQSLDPAHPKENIRLAGRYLSYLLGRARGNEALAVAAYGQGLASVQRSGIHPGTRQYVADVLALRDRFAA